MNYDRLKQRHIDRTPTADLLEEGIITQEQADDLADDFERRLQHAMQTKGYALPGDVHPYPRSEMLRRLSGAGEQAGGGMGC